MDANVNEYMKDCLDHFGYDRNLTVEERFQEVDFRKAANCALKHRVGIYLEDNKLTASFLEANPHFRYPGLALPNGAKGNLDPCWGRNDSYSANGRC